MDNLKSYGAQVLNKSMGFLNSDGLIPQLVLTVIIVLAIHFLIVAVESLITGIQKYNQLNNTLFDYTISSDGDTGMKGTVFNSKDTFLYPSENEVHGIEFSYSFHLYIDPQNYKTERTGNQGFRSVFYRGGEHPWPLLGPGVFVNATDNSMRVYMNSINDIASQYVEIPNVPVGKWFHMVLVQKGQNMDVYLNGNIAVRHTFDTIPKINFGSVYVFPGEDANTTVDNSANGPIAIRGPMQGMISRLKYYAYALSFSQIDSLYSEGASKKIKSTSYDFKPPYLHDSWWVTRYGDHNPHYGL